MPQSMIVAVECECCRCDYKWVLRKNGKHKEAPKYCPHCKSSLWDTERINVSLWDKNIDRQNRIRRMKPSQRLMEKGIRWIYEHPVERYHRRHGEMGFPYPTRDAEGNIVDSSD